MVATAWLIVTEIPALQQTVLWSHVNGEGSYSLTMSLQSRVRWCWALKMDSACTISQHNDLFWGNVSAPKLPTGWSRQEGSGAAWPHLRDMRALRDPELGFRDLSQGEGIVPAFDEGPIVRRF